VDKIAPFKSKAQQRFMFAKERRGELPKGTARRWAHETPSIKSLPEKKAMLIEKIARTPSTINQKMSLNKQRDREARINLLGIPAAGVGATFVTRRGALGIARKLERRPTHSEAQLRKFLKEVGEKELGGKIPQTTISRFESSQYIPGKEPKVLTTPRMGTLAHELGHAKQFQKGTLGSSMRLRSMGPVFAVPSEVGASARALKYLYRYGGKKRGIGGLIRAAKAIPALAAGLTTYGAGALIPASLAIAAARQLKAEARIKKEDKAIKAKRARKP